MSTETEAKLDQAKKDIKLAVEVAGKEIAALEKQIADEAKPKLDYDKPIMAVTGDGTLVMLVANCNTTSFDIKGYDWLRIKDGIFNSCRLWKTKEEAVNAYSYQKPFNCDLDDLKAMQKPLANFSLDVHDYGYNPCFENTPFKIAGNWHTLEEAEAFSMNIKRLIATAKRNKNK